MKRHLVICDGCNAEFQSHAFYIQITYTGGNTYQSPEHYCGVCFPLSKNRIQSYVLAGNRNTEVRITTEQVY